MGCSFNTASSQWAGTCGGSFLGNVIMSSMGMDHLNLKNVRQNYNMCCTPLALGGEYERW
jgi:hypothetical protein